jgi:AraC-like DNA-binding protein
MNFYSWTHMFYLGINIFTFLHIAFLFSILVVKKNNASKLLAFVILIPGINTLNNINILTENIYRFPYTLFIAFTTAQLYSVVIYNYCRFFMNKPLFRFSPVYLVPLAIILLNLYYFIEFLGMEEGHQTAYLSGLLHGQYPDQMMIINGLFILNQFVVFIVSIVELNRHIRNAKQFYSDIDIIKIGYIKFFLWLVIILNLMLTLLYMVLPPHICEYLVIPVILIIINLFFVANAFQNAVVFTPPQYMAFKEQMNPLNSYIEKTEPLCRLMEQEAKGGKYKIFDAEIEHYYKVLKMKLEQQQIYRNPNITLGLLSESIGACSHTVSATINNKFGMNFFDLINSYRIRDIEERLKSFNPDKDKIEAIAYEYGFSSKTAFYRAFKKHTGKVPSEMVMVA